MVSDPRVTHCLARLGGVYRDPNRIDRDAASLLKSSVGAHLQPIVSSMVENNGDSSSALVLQGTIAMHFRGNTYQLLIDMYLPSGYPNRPPVCFVRLAPGMYLKENHRHVGSDGKVYLPYLSEWQPSSHNLVELVVAMSSVFSSEPPVFSRPTRSSVAHPPPPPPPQQPLPGWGHASESEREAILAVEAAEANEAAEAARRAAQAEEEARQRQLMEQQLAAERERDRQRAFEEQRRLEQDRLQQVRMGVDNKVRQALLTQLAECRAHLISDSKDEQRLELATEQKIERQLENLTKLKSEYEEHLSRADQKLEDIQFWLEEHRQSAKPAEQVSVDEMVVPASPIDGQMMDLAAENQALEDALYFVDKALYRSHINAETLVRQVRNLSRRQFLVRAHLLKIQQSVLFQKR